MTVNYKKAIQTIVEFKENFDCIDPTSKIPKKLVGEVGEFYALNKMVQMGMKLKHKGGQAGFDILIENNGKKVEVRTSLLKNEGLYSDEDIRFFGWRVKNRNQKTDRKFDILIAVALDETFKKPNYYIFTHEEAFLVQDVEIGRFKNVQKKIHLFENKELYKRAVKDKPRLVTKYERYINEHLDEFKDQWGKIK